jgi:hypothetical protein
MKKITALFLILFMAASVMPAEYASENGDVNCDEAVNILDVVHLINFKYKEGPPPCEFGASPGASWVHYSYRTIDVGYAYSNLATLHFMAPDDGFASISFSLYVETESYNLGYRLYDAMPDKGESDRSYSEIFQYNPDSPLSWTEVFPVTEGLNTIYLDVRGVFRDGEEPTRLLIDFANVNMSALYFPENYTVIPRD